MILMDFVKGLETEISILIILNDWFSTFTYDTIHHCLKEELKEKTGICKRNLICCLKRKYDHISLLKVVCLSLYWKYILIGLLSILISTSLDTKMLFSKILIIYTLLSITMGQTLSGT